MTTPAQVIAERRTRRQQLLDRARNHVEQLPAPVEVRAAIVVGSVARGDFNDASDIDLLVVADGLAHEPARRWEQVAAREGLVQPVAWTIDEWHRQRASRNPLVVDALDHGVWLRGRADQL